MTFPWQRSLQARVVLILVGLLSLVLLLVNVGMAGVLARTQLEEAANHLQIQALIAAQNLADPLSGYHHELEEDDDGDDDHRRLVRWADNYAAELDSEVLVTDARGRAVVGNGTLEAAELSSARGGQPFHRWTGQTIYASAPVVRGDDLEGVVRLSVPREQASGRARTLSLSLAAASLLALGTALLGAVVLSRRLVGPLQKLEASALRAARGDWDQVVEAEGEDELASLARAFATMLSELRRMFEKQRRFVGNASHELRTPLTRIKLRTEALVEGGLDDERAERFLREVDQEVDHLTRLARALLDLSRLEEGRDPGTTHDLVALLRSLTARVDRELAVELPESLPPVRLSPESLETVVSNLLDNAVRYTPPEGQIRLRARRSDGGVELVVEDSGAGIAPEHLPHLFDRFYRADPARARGGTGLGLALVRAAVEAAGGTVSAWSEPGRGSRFTVNLPGA